MLNVEAEAAIRKADKLTVTGSTDMLLTTFNAFPKIFSHIHGGNKRLHERFSVYVPLPLYI